MNSASRSLLLLMADVTVRATVLMALTAIIAILSRRASASFRHLVWALGLGCTLFLPLLTVALPSWKIAVRSLPILPQSVPAVPQIQQASTAPTEALVPPLTSFHPDAPVPAADHAPTTNKSVVAHSAPLPSAASVHPILPWTAWVILVWALGVVLFLAQLARGLATVKKIERKSVPVTNGSTLDLLSEAKTLMKVRRPVALRQASDLGPISVPLTYGALRPVIMLPAVAPQWPQERLRAVLLHEVAHVRRTDWSLQILMHIARALYWFHPLAWLSTRRARAESETAADNLVLASGMPAQDYARQLLDVALSARRQGNLGLGAVAMAQTPKIEGRLRLILSLGRRRGEIGGRTRAMILSVAVCVLAVGSVVRVASRAAGTPGDSPSPSFPVRMADASNPRVILPNGATVRLLGVKDTQAGPSGWWKPDGTSLTTPLPKSTLVFPSLPAGTQGRAFAVDTSYVIAAQPRLTLVGKPNFGWAYGPAPGGPYHYYAKPSFTWEFVPDDHIRDLNHFQQSETHAAGGQSMLVQTALAIRASDRTRTVKWAVAAGPWTHSVSCPKKAGKARIKTPSGDVIFTLIPNPHGLTDPKAVGSGNAVFMESDALGSRMPSGESGLPVRDTDYDREILALDGSGRVLYDLRGGVMPEASGRTENLTNIPNLILRKVASFRLLARPYQWAEFRGVQLQPQTSVASTPLPATSQGQPDTAAAHVARGEHLQQQGQPRDGIPEFRRAVQIDPNNAEAREQLAEALYEIRWKHFRMPLRDTRVSFGTPPAVLDEAIRHMRRAVALRPNDARWHSTLGTYLSNRGRHREAVAEYRHSMHLMPPLSPADIKPSTDGSIPGNVAPWYDAYWTLGEELVQTGHYQEAVMNLRQALRFNPSSDSNLLWLGDALNGSGHRAEARAAWKKSLAAKPPNSYYQRQARARLARY